MKTFAQYLKESQHDLLSIKGVTRKKLDSHIMSRETLDHIKTLHDKVFGVSNEQIILDANESKMPNKLIDFLESNGVNTTSKTGNHVFDALTIMYNNRAIDLLKFLGKNKASPELVKIAENYYRPIKNQTKVSQGFKILISRKKEIGRAHV